MQHGEFSISVLYRVKPLYTKKFVHTEKLRDAITSKLLTL